jgi:glycosyltransferase involved in cell wall biosynthesis
MSSEVQHVEVLGGEDRTQRTSGQLSVTVIAGEVENEIRECLESVTWADEIIVVNSSADRTAEIAREFTDKVLVRGWSGYGSQKQFALESATKEWVLSLDTDERVSEALREEIRTVLSHASNYDGYYIPRRGYFLGHWIRHCGWYPDYQLRLFRREKARVNDRRIHESFTVTGPVGFLKNDLHHYTHPTIAVALAKGREYAALEAAEKVEKKRVNALLVLLHPLFEFFSSFFLKQGFRDGAYGLMVCMIHAMTDMQTYLRMWEARVRSRREHEET